MADSFVTEWDADAILQQIRQRRAQRAQTQLGGQLQLPAPPTPQQVAPAPERKRNIIERMLEPIGRPQQALFGLAEGGAPAAWQALQGQGPRRTFGGMLERAGVPELGSVNLFGKQFTGRGALGAVGDIGVDPLNLIPFGKVAGAVRGAPAVARAAAGIARPMELGAAMTRFAEPTAATRAVRAVARMPVIGGAVKKLADLATKRTLATEPVHQLALAHQEVLDTVVGAVASNMADLPGQTLRSTYRADPQYLVLANGRRMPNEDVARLIRARPVVAGEYDYTARLYEELLPAEDVAWFRSAKSVYKQVRAAFQETHRRLAEINPDAAKKINVEDRLLAEGEEHFPRVVLEEPVARMPWRVAMPGWERDVELLRKYPKQADGIAVGIRYADAPTALRVRLQEMWELNAAMELSIELAPYAKQMDTAAIELASQAMRSALERVGQLGSREGGALALAQRAVRGESLPGATMRRLGEIAPEVHDAVAQAVAIPQGRFSATLSRFTTELQSLARIAPQRLAAKVAENREVDWARSAGRVRGLGAAPRRGPITWAETQRSLRELGADDNQTIDLLEKIYDEAWRFPQAARKAMLQDVVETARGLSDNAAEGLQKAREALKGVRGVEAEKVAGLIEAPGRALKGLFWEPGMAEKLQKTLAPQLHPALAGPQAVAQASRTVRAGFLDWSMAFIQALPALAVQPDAWLRGFTTMARGFFSRNPEQALMQHRASDVSRLVQRMFPGASRAPLTQAGEYFAGTQPIGQFAGRLGGMLPTAAQAPARGVGRSISRLTFERTQTAFQTMGEVTRDYWLAAMAPGAQKAGKLRELEDLVNFGTGVFSSRARGITPNQTAIEGTFLLFAPSYTKSAVALTGMLLGNSYSRSQAIKALGSMLVVGVTMYDNLATATGQEPVLDPTDSRFLTLEVGGHRVGIGSVWTALARLLGKSVIDPRTDEMDFGQVVRADRDNPLVRFFWGREAPVGGALWDLAMQESYMGQPLDSVPNIGLYLGTKLMPFAVEAAILQRGRGGIPGVATEQVAQFAGLRSFPEGLSDVRDDVAQEMFQQPYRELTPEQKGQVDVDQRIRTLPTARGKRGEESRARAGAFEREREALEPLAQQVRAGTLSKYAFRKAYNDIAEELGTRIGDIEERFPSEPSTDPRAKARGEYLAIMRDETLGEERFDRAEEFYASLSPEMQAYIESAQLGRYERIGGEAAKLLREYWGVKKVLKPYWEIFDQALERRGLKEQWDSLNDVERRAFTQTRQYSLVNRDVTRLRERLRRTNSAVDAALVEWGYVSRSIRERKS